MTMNTIRIGNNDLTWDEHGTGEAILLLSGWCQDHRLFKTLAPELARTHRVIRLDWRGHGLVRDHDGDFGLENQVDDVAAFLDAKGIERVLPVSTSHGGWANIGLTDRLGAARIPRTVVIDWIQTTPNAAFFTAIEELQQPGHWLRGRQDLFDYWIGATANRDVIDHVTDEMGGYSFEMWARSGREIARAYGAWGNPMQRMAALAEKRPIMHLFSQPFEDEYHEAQKAFAAENPWYHPVKLPGETHFPTLEQPANVAAEIRRFAQA